MEKSILYKDKLYFSHLDLTDSDKGFNINVIGFSGDALRTCIYYEIENNPLDYQVQEAYLIDNQKKIYSLVSVERICSGERRKSFERRTSGEMREVCERRAGKDRRNEWDKEDTEEPLIWMEFGAIPPGTKKLELIIINLHQSPTPGSFKFKASSFIDPWDPDLILSNNTVEKLYSWGGIRKTLQDDTCCEWECSGNWRFCIPLGNWVPRDYDVAKILNFDISLGKEKIFFKEYRNSDTGAFIVFEVKNENILLFGHSYNKKIVEKFITSSGVKEFEENLMEMGIDRGYIPVKLNIRLRDRENDILYSPDYVQSWGIVSNRKYNFFNDCIKSRNMEILVQEIMGLKLDKPLEINLNPYFISSQEPVSINYDAGALRVKGDIFIDELLFLEEGIKITYRTKLSESLKSLTFRNPILRVNNLDGKIEEFPALGSSVHLDPTGEYFEKTILFPMFSLIETIMPDDLCLVVDSVDVKLSKPLVYPFIILDEENPYSKYK